MGELCWGGEDLIGKVALGLNLSVGLLVTGFLFGLRDREINYFYQLDEKLFHIWGLRGGSFI